MKNSFVVFCSLVLLSVMVAFAAPTAYAQSVAKMIPVSQGPLKQVNPYFRTQATTYSDGAVIVRSDINGPPEPPPGFLTRPTVSLPAPMPEMAVNTLTDVPKFRWVFGCSAVSGSMIAGYHDRNGFPNMYTGATNGGIVPLEEDPSWGTWTDVISKPYPNNPLIASHNGLDGRATRGSIDDYWVSYGSDSSDPYITGSWTQHAWADAVGDYMKTSQSEYDNVDGSTSFFVNKSATPLTCADMETYDIDAIDGTYGRKLFYEARGYTVTDCYTQMTDNVYAGGFSFNQFKAEIDAGRPVLLNVQGHSMVGVGYDDSTNTVYIHDTWDHNVHTMPWGGSYSGMALWGVSIVNLAAAAGDPDISVSPSSHNFGTIAVSTTATQTFTISNTGTADLDVGAISISGSDFSINSDTCSNSTVTPSSSCTVRVAFSPATAGAKSATLSIPSDDPDENQLTVALSGTGTVSDLLPDLYGAWSNVSRSSSKRFSTVSGTFTTTNGGTVSARNAKVYFYLSTDGTYSSGDTLVKTYKYKTIDEGSSRSTTVSFRTTSNPSGKYLVAVIDPLNNIIESNEKNNSASAIIH